MNLSLPKNLTNKLSPFYCTKCGYGWPLDASGPSGAVSSLKHPGYFDHFPNCPGEEYVK